MPSLRRVAFVLLLGAVTVAAQTTDRTLSRAGTSNGQRIALVIGNDAYPNAVLQNARNDARAVAGALREIGFIATLLEDATQASMGRAVAELGERLGPDDVVFFFFAGHGLQLGGENYLVPTDYRGSSELAARFGAIGASQIQDALRKAKVSMIVLDACRNNPYSGQRAGGGGLAAMEARGSLIAFATGAGQTASDNATSANGLFIQELLRVLREPNLGARDVFFRVRQRVFDASKGRQFPAVYDGLLGEYVFRPTAAPAIAPPTASASDAELQRREEIAFWESIPTNGDAQLVRQLLEEYEQRFGPKGRFSTVARARLTALSPAAAPTATALPAVIITPATDKPPDAEIESLVTECDRGSGPACREVGLRYGTGRGITQDNTRAATYYQRGCDRGDAAGCNLLGVLYSNGRGVDKDDARAASLYQRGCDGGIAAGCANLGSRYDNGRGVTPDAARAAAPYQRGCDGGIAWACVNLGTMYELGRGVTQDFTTAITLYERGCNGRDGLGCRYWAMLLERRLGTDRNPARAIEIYGKGCENKDQESCAAVKRLAGN